MTSDEVIPSEFKEKMSDPYGRIDMILSLVNGIFTLYIRRSYYISDWRLLSKI